MATATSTPEVQDQEAPDSLEIEEQEPTAEPEGEPSPEEDAAPEGDPSAADEAEAAGQPDPESAAPDGPARDEHGRFTSSQAAPEEPSQPEADASTPFSFRVDGVPVDVEGAEVRGDSITFSREAWERSVQPRLVDRGRIAQRETRMQTRIRDLESERTAESERAKVVLGAVDALLSDRDALIAFVNNYDAQAPQLRLKIENELLRSQTQRHETAQKSASEETRLREFTESARPGLEAAVSEILDGAAKDAKLDRKKLADELWELSEAGTPIFFKVTEGDGSGLDPREFEYGINTKLVYRLISPRIELAKSKSSTKTTKAEAVRQLNAQATGKAKPTKAPPTVPASGSPTPGGEAKHPTTPEEFREWKARRMAELKLPMM